jgi:hypothetical protein
MVFGTV